MLKKIVSGTLIYLVYLFISTILIALCFEGSGRAIIHIRFDRPGKSYGLWKYDPELGAVHRPNAYNTMLSLNNHGLRNQEDVFEPKPSNSLRIIAFGGSTTFGYNLHEGETFTEKLEHRLRQIPHYERTQVLNAGAIDFSAGHNIILMKRLLPRLKPDYVILYEGLNEFPNALFLERSGVSIENLTPQHYGLIYRHLDQSRWLKRNSILIRFIDYYLKKAIISLRSLMTVYKEQRNEASPVVEEAPMHPWVIENYKYLLGKMIDLIRSEGGIPLIVKYAYYRHSYVRPFSDSSEEVAKSKGALICDMKARFEQRGVVMKELFIHTGLHVTKEGAELLADELFKVITGDLENGTVKIGKITNELKLEGHDVRNRG